MTDLTFPVVILFSTIALLSSNQAADFDQYYLLPKSVRPFLYDIALSFSLESDKYHDGEVNIQANIVEATSKITLHASPDLKIFSVQLWNRTKSEIHVNNVSRNSTRHTLELALSSPLAMGECVNIHIAYQWPLCTTIVSDDADATFNCAASLKYLGAQNKKPKSATIRPGWIIGKAWNLYTKMQPNGARALLPCFDEPAFKAQFDVTVTLVGKGYGENPTVLANMPLLRRTDRTYRFERSPPFSTYLLALAISRDEISDRYSTSNGAYEVTVWGFAEAVSDDKNHTITTADVDKQVKEEAEDLAATFTSMEKRTGIVFPASKIDYVFAGSKSTENWGLIIGKPKDATHEAVHGWFGNLVTCDWWNDVWLNEAITTFYTWLLNDGDPAFIRFSKLVGLDCEYVLSDVHYFDDYATHYDVGTHLVHMFRKVVGVARFDRRIGAYLEKYRFKTVTSAQFIEAMTEADEWNERRMMEDFIFKHGVPRITVRREQNSIVISQQPTCGSFWTAPIWFRRNSEGKYEEELLWLSENEKQHTILLANDEDAKKFTVSCETFAAIKVPRADGQGEQYCYVGKG